MTLSLRQLTKVPVTFNCTIEELKSTGPGAALSLAYAFNCTIEELKCLNRQVVLAASTSFNCTIEELKYRCSGATKQFTTLLIVP